MSKIKSEIELLNSFISQNEYEENVKVYNHHKETLQKAIKDASQWSLVFGRRIKGRYEKHWVKIMKVQERAKLVLNESAEMNLEDTIKYFIERGEYLEELFLLKKYYDFVCELKVRKTYDYQVVSQYSFKLHELILAYVK